MKNDVKKVLVAAYYFPPYAEVSGTRVLKFCKYLPRFGWTPLILTVNSNYYKGNVVATSPPEISKMKIIRIPFIFFPGCVFFTKLLYPILIGLTAYKYRKHIHAVYICGSPYYPFFITSWITRVLNISSVLDFRDAWSNNDFLDKDLSMWRRKINSLVRSTIETVGIKNASAVIFATSYLQHEYSNIYPQHSEKFFTINNGFDKDDLIGIKARRLVSSKSIILTGKIYYYSPQLIVNFLEALKRFPDLTFIYVGNEASIVTELCNKTRVENQVVVKAYLPYLHTLSLISGADYGLVSAPLPNCLGTKIFDYMYLSKPILCFVPEGSQIKKQFGHLPSVFIYEPPYKIGKIERALEELLASNLSPINYNSITGEFSRENNTKRLSLILNDINI